MKNVHVSLIILVLVSAASLTACAQESSRTENRAASVRASAAAATPAVAQAPSAGPPPAADAAALSLPLVVVNKAPTCGCCGAWVDHMRQAGFTVEVRNFEDLNPIKERLGVPYGKGSCHTAEVAGYFVEGHVPADDVKRLLHERPVAKGLTVPGMPLGSPGMEVPDGSVQPYVVELVARDGTTSEFARHGH
jgi:hypothetical protein